MQLKLVIDWIIEGLITSKGYGIIFGPSGVGKTQLGLQLARSIACGDDFLVWKNPTRQPRKVMFFSLEMGPEDAAYFMQQMDKSLSETQRTAINENLLVVPLGEAMPLDKPEGKEFFENLIKEYKPEALFIDSLGTMTRGNLLEDGPARTMLEYIQYLKKIYQCAIYVIHHANKANIGPGLTLQDFYGNTYLFTGTDFVLGVAFVDQDVKDALRVSLCKMRLSKGLAPFDIIRTNELTFTTGGVLNLGRVHNSDGGPSALLGDFGF